jgi:hypothetical protein
MIGRQRRRICQGSPPSMQAEGKDEGDPTLDRPVRRSALSRSDPRRCQEGCNPHPAVPSPRSSAKSHRQGALSAKGQVPCPIGSHRARSFFPDLGRPCPRGRSTKPEQCGARSVSGQMCAHLRAPRWMASGAGFLNLSWSSPVCPISKEAIMDKDVRTPRTRLRAQ